MAKWLTKSDYMKFLISPAYLWLAKHAKDKLPPLSESDEFMMQQGHEVEEIARQLFPDGQLVPGELMDNLKNTYEALKRSAYVAEATSAKWAVQDDGNEQGNGIRKDPRIKSEDDNWGRGGGVKTLFQAAVLTDRRLYARSDVVQSAGAAWDIWEVKSSTKVKADHIHDLAFQKIAWEEAGYAIRKCGVIHINTQYERQGEIEPAKLFRQRDVSRQVEAELDSTREQIERALEVMAAPYRPDDTPAASRNLGAWLEIYRHLHPDLPTTSIYNLTRLQLVQVQQLAGAQIADIGAIPASFKLKPQQRRQVELIKLGRRSVHAGRIAHELGRLEYPLYFLDYETVGPAVPLWDGARPYKALPFQYSLHRIDQPGGELSQTDFLATGSAYPALELAQQLQRDLGPTGSVVVWYKDFEMGVNSYLAELHPELAEFLHGVNARVFDLMEIFSNGWYAHPDFYGSASIKKVLPVVVPEMNYAELGIQKGDVASLRWLMAATGKLPPAEAQTVYADLRVYCGQDTLAMVRIYEHLMELTRSAGLVDSRM